MDFSTLDTLFNFVLLAFWLRIWTADERVLYFNPNLSAVNQAVRPIFDAIRRISNALPVWLETMIVIALLILFRGIAFPSNVMWALIFGFELQACPAGFGYHILFSLLSFALFLFKVWGISLLYMASVSHPYDHASESLHFASRPFSRVPAPIRPLVLMLTGIAVGLSLNMAGGSGSEVITELNTRAISFLPKLAISAIAGWVSILPAIGTIMVVLIIGSWVGLFANSAGLAVFCRQWLDLFLGFLRNRPLMLGPIDLTPLIVIFAIHWIYPLLIRILHWGYVMV